MASIGKPYGYSTTELANTVTVVATVIVLAGAVIVLVTVTVVVRRGRMVKGTQPVGVDKSPSTWTE
jgi:hypothetical protein